MLQYRQPLYVSFWAGGTRRTSPPPPRLGVLLLLFFVSEPNVFHRPVTKIKAGRGLSARLRRSASHSLASSGKKNTRLPQAGQRPRLAVVFTPTQYIQCRHKYIKRALELHSGRGEGEKVPADGKTREISPGVASAAPFPY